MERAEFNKIEPLMKLLLLEAQRGNTKQAIDHAFALYDAGKAQRDAENEDRARGRALLLGKAA